MKILILLGLFVSSTLLASVEGEVGVYSNFIWRGTTFTENKPAVQAQIDGEEKNGFFINTFLSNAEFSDEALGNDATVTSEVDGAVGKRFYGEDWMIQLAYYRFTFPGASVFDTDDWNIQGKWKHFLFELSYMDDYFGYKGAYRYLRLGYEWAFSHDLEAAIFIGYNDFVNPKGDIKTRCLDSGCNELAETLNGAANKNYFDLYIVGSKKIANDQKVELGLNITDRKEYLVEGGEIETDRAKDFAAVISWTVPITIIP
ncbi:MAG: TorF family putative porin [Bacteriovoracaceae bacterium]|jgi:hypothetical protein